MPQCQGCGVNVAGVCMSCMLTPPNSNVQLPQPSELPSPRRREPLVARVSSPPPYRAITVRSCSRCPFGVAQLDRWGQPTRWCDANRLLGEEPRRTHFAEEFIPPWCPLNDGSPVRVSISGGARTMEFMPPETIVHGPVEPEKPPPDLWQHLTGDDDAPV